jgi:hypothetical protein
MTRERKLELQRILESFDLNAVGLTALLLTVIVLAGAAVAAIVVIL